MDIHLISSLTPEDEQYYGELLLAAIAGLLDHAAIPYTLRVETSGGHVLERQHTATDEPARHARPDALAIFPTRGRPGRR